MKSAGEENTSSSLVDRNVIEALESSRDRISVLRLEQDIVEFLADNDRTVLEVPSLNSYQRLLAHKTAEYYKLTHVSDNNRQILLFHKHPWSKIPAVKLCDIQVPTSTKSAKAAKASITPVQVKIMKRDAGRQLTTPERLSTLVLPDAAQEREKEKIDKEERYRLARARIFQGVEESQITQIERLNHGDTRAKSQPTSRSNSRDARPKARKWEQDTPSASRPNDFQDLTVNQSDHESPAYSRLAGGGIQQRYQQYYQAASPQSAYSRPPLDSTHYGVWNSRSTTPLSMANLATLEAQTSKQSFSPSASIVPLPSGPAMSPKPAGRALFPPLAQESKVWGPPSTPVAGRSASAKGLNLEASPWNPKPLAQEQPRDEAGDVLGLEDPTNVLRGLALDGK